MVENNNNNNKKVKPLTIGGIPIIAIVFPPLGILMLLKYLLNKNKKEGLDGKIRWFIWNVFNRGEHCSMVYSLICMFSDDRWGFLICGSDYVSIAIVHGVGIWFGVW